MNLTGKQKSYLGGLAHSYKPVFQIGKESISEDMIDCFNKYLTKHELMKVSILQNCDDTSDEIISKIEQNEINVIKKIGSVLILYKPNYEKENHIIIP